MGSVREWIDEMNNRDWIEEVEGKRSLRWYRMVKEWGKRA